MLKTNSKQARQKIRDFIASRAQFGDYNGWNDYPKETPQDFDGIAAYIDSIFYNEYIKYNNSACRYSREALFWEWASGLPSVGLFDYIYFGEGVQLVGDILEESETERAKFDEIDAEKLLTRLIYREITARKTNGARA